MAIIKTSQQIIDCHKNSKCDVPVYCFPVQASFFANLQTINRELTNRALERERARLFNKKQKICYFTSESALLSRVKGT